MNFLRKLGFSAFAFLTVLAFLALRPAPASELSSCETIQGIVADVQLGNSQEIVITLTNTDRVFYINRGQELGFDVNIIKDLILEEEVTLYYPHYWTPLDPTASIRNLTGIQLGDQLVFSEETRC